MKKLLWFVIIMVLLVAACDAATSSTPESAEVLDLKVNITSNKPEWMVKYSRDATQADYGKSNEGCAYFTFSLEGSKPIYRYSSIRNPQFQAALEISNNGQLFEKFGPRSLKDMDRYGDTFFLADRENCQYAKLPNTGEYRGKEFHLMLLMDGKVLTEWRGIYIERYNWQK